MTEFDLIARLTRSLPTNDSVLVGPGDDCAVLDLAQKDRVLLFKTDAVVEGIHFAAETPPEKIGHKALARCLSDIAAMAGTPTCALVTLALPRGFRVEVLDGIYRGLSELARRHGVAISGGETTTNPERMLLSIALVGWAPRGKVTLRSGAKLGDAIFVTGKLGGSLAGHHLDFEPRLTEARWLAAHFPIHAMMDLSDGLAGDLRHILNASGVGALLLGKSIPISRAARERARQRSTTIDEPALPTPPTRPANGAPTPGNPKPALLAALTDGEDFELLFTTASRNAVALLDGWKKEFPAVPLTCVGRITEEPGLKIQTEHGVHELHAHGYVHFA